MGFDQAAAAAVPRLPARCRRTAISARPGRRRGPSLEDLFQRFPATLELVTFGLLLAIAIGFPLGVAAARFKPGRVAHGRRLLRPAGGSPARLLAGAGADLRLLHACSAGSRRRSAASTWRSCRRRQSPAAWSSTVCSPATWKRFRSAFGASGSAGSDARAHQCRPDPEDDAIDDRADACQSDFAATQMMCGLPRRARAATCRAHRPALDRDHHQRALRLPDRRRRAGRDRVLVGRCGPICRAGRAQRRHQSGAGLRPLLGDPLAVGLSDRRSDLLRARPADQMRTPLDQPSRRRARSRCRSSVITISGSTFPTRSAAEPVSALKGIDLRIGTGEFIGLVGEFGRRQDHAGARSIMGLPPPPGRIERGEVCVRWQRDLLALPEPERARRCAAASSAMVIANPRAELNPLLTGRPRRSRTIARDPSRASAARGAARWRSRSCAPCSIPDPERRLGAYAHELSRRHGAAGRHRHGADLLAAAW